MKTFLVEVMTQYGSRFEPAHIWRTFETYSANSKREAIRQARRYNTLHGCLDGRSNGLIWWRAIELHSHI